MWTYIFTGSGFWNPIWWLASFVIVAIFVYSFFGNEVKAKYSPDKMKPFLSGWDEVNKEAMQVKASNIYWGFTKAMSGYYRCLDRCHTGIINDYVVWFMAVMVITFITFITA